MREGYPHKTVRRRLAKFLVSHSPQREGRKTMLGQLPRGRERRHNRIQKTMTTPPTPPSAPTQESIALAIAIHSACVEDCGELGSRFRVEKAADMINSHTAPLLARLKQAEEDTGRLDFIESTGIGPSRGKSGRFLYFARSEDRIGEVVTVFDGATARASIDAAISAGGGT